MNQLKRKVLSKWLKIIRFHKKDYGGRDCAYCEKYYFDTDKECIGCPICEYTNKTNCADTYYSDWLLSTSLNNRYVHDQKSLKAAKDEYNFLKNLKEN